jgi:hypothetical protein
MPSALVRPDSIRFPQKCPHCLRKAEGTYAVAAVRGIDAFLGGYSVPLLLDVPVCRGAFERRRQAALASLVAVLLMIVTGAAFAAWFAFHGAWLASVLPGGVALALAAGGRTGWDGALLDGMILKMTARSISSTEVRMQFSRDDYFAAWSALNRVKRS